MTSFIRKDIPFYPNRATITHPDGEHCLPICIKMILGCLMPESTFSLAELEQITQKTASGGTFPTHYLLWLVEHDFEVKRWDPHDWKAFRHEGIDYIRRAIGEEAATYNASNFNIAFEQSVIDQFLQKVPLVTERPTVDMAEAALRDGWMLRTGVNAHLINGQEGYLGHSVVIIGFDERDVVFHDPGMPPQPARRVERGRFQEAMDSFGGELDAIRLKVIPS